MKYFYYLLIIIVVYALFSYGRIWYFSNYSKNPEIKPANLNIGSGAPLRYIAAGDSTAVGEGASSVEQTYPYKVAESLSKTNTVTYKNVAVSGARTKDVISVQLSQIIEYNPDVITISIGGNDATHLVSQKVIIENYRLIIDRLTKETKAKIYITNIPNFVGASLLPWWYIQLLEHRSKSINRALLKMEPDRVHIINIHDFGWDQFPDRKFTYSLDHFHPSDIGYQNWVNAFLDKITLDFRTTEE